MAPYNDSQLEALRNEIEKQVISRKGNACPMMCRLAWHSSGTYDTRSQKGGSNGATMRFQPESTDDANAGLSVARDMLVPIKMNHPELSFADLWTYTGCLAIEWAGGPKIPFRFGRTDATTGMACPMNGLLPDASKGADHIRDVFYRMGFNDREITALNGAHTLGRCHRSRSGYEGPWTRDPLKFDNAFFKNLLYLEWRPKRWDGPLQYEDVQTGELMMTPTDMAFLQDNKFREYVELYARDQDAFFRDFAAAYSKLLHFGHPESPEAANNMGYTMPSKQKNSEASEKFIKEAGSGRLWMAEKLWKSGEADVHAVDAGGRSALHKASLSGHAHVVDFLLKECKLNPNVQDLDGDTALHDASRYEQLEIISKLLAAGADVRIKNREGQDSMALAKSNGKEKAMALLSSGYNNSRYQQQQNQNSHQNKPQAPSPMSPPSKPNFMQIGEPKGMGQPTTPIHSRYYSKTLDLRGARVLITGSTSADGIGRACAFRFAELGCQLILVGRDDQSLLSLAREIKAEMEAYGNRTPLPELVRLDLHDMHMIQDLPNRIGPIDVLINNTGVMDAEAAEHAKVNEAVSMITSNLVAPMALVMAFGPSMKARRNGHIINVCSMEDVLVNGSVYCSTKAALQAYTQASRQDFADTPVRFTTISPGNADQTAKDGVNHSMPCMSMDPQDIADQVVYSATRPFHMQVADLSAFGAGNTNGRESPMKYLDMHQQSGMSTRSQTPTTSGPPHWGNNYADQGQMPPRPQSELGHMDKVPQASGNRPFNGNGRGDSNETVKYLSNFGEKTASDEWASKQRELMIQQRDIMLKQPGKAWAKNSHIARDNHFQPKCPVLDSQSDAQRQRERMIQGMGGGCPFMGTMGNSQFLDMQSPPYDKTSANRSASPMIQNFHPFGVSTPPESPRYVGANGAARTANNMVSTGDLTRIVAPSYGW